MRAARPVVTPVPARTWESVTFVPLPTASIRPSKRSAPPPAATIRDVLTTRNPKNEHGKTSQLTAQQIDDLAEYLLSL